MKGLAAAYLFSSAFLFTAAQVDGQYVIHQVEYRLPLSQVQVDREFENPMEEAKFFLELPESRIAAEGPAAKEEMTVYTDGKRLTVESSGEESGHTTFILDLESGKSLIVFWDQRQILESDRQEMAAIKQEAEKAAEEMIAQLPPEAQEQARKALAQMKKKTAPQVKTTPTGKKATKYGMACEQFLVEHGDKISLVWAAKDDMGLVKIANAIEEGIESIFQSGEAQSDEWDWVQGWIPVEARTFLPGDGFTPPSIRVRAITKIEKRMPAEGRFQLPAAAAKFPRRPLREFLMQMRQQD